METIPPAVTGPTYQHPEWCSWDDCTSPDALAARNVNPDDVPQWRRDCHWSAARTISAGTHGDVSFTFAGWSMCFQTPEDAEKVEAVHLTITWAEVELVVGVPVDISQLLLLSGAFQEYADLADGHHASGGYTPTVVDRAIWALTPFGTLDRSDAAALLSMWSKRAELTDEQRAMILDRYPAGGAA